MIGDALAATPNVAAGTTVSVPLQTAVGGSESVVVLAFAGLLIATGLSMLVVVRLVQGYRRNGTRPMLYLGAGLALLVTAPMVLRLVLSNLVVASPAVRSLATAGLEVLGLAAILYAIYDP
ncbi:hypothetical protein [Halorussus litoreus]|uniref:hypothetical protein n=1 Tax=Halorussus litoreus TaxID=1710536 RepID=UPI000E225033|nr:hypothetical protein [Halorussus litoreus]